MSAHYCPDCHQPIGPRKREQDARCADCRAEVGHRRQRHHNTKEN